MALISRARAVEALRKTAAALAAEDDVMLHAILNADLALVDELNATVRGPMAMHLGNLLMAEALRARALANGYTMTQQQVVEDIHGYTEEMGAAPVSPANLGEVNWANPALEVTWEDEEGPLVMEYEREPDGTYWRRRLSDDAPDDPPKPFAGDTMAPVESRAVTPRPGVEPDPKSQCAMFSMPPTPSGGAGAVAVVATRPASAQGYSQIEPPNHQLCSQCQRSMVTREDRRGEPCPDCGDGVLYHEGDKRPEKWEEELDDVLGGGDPAVMLPKHEEAVRKIQENYVSAVGGLDAGKQALDRASAVIEDAGGEPVRLKLEGSVLGPSETPEDPAPVVAHAPGRNPDDTPTLCACVCGCVRELNPDAPTDLCAECFQGSSVKRGQHASKRAGKAYRERLKDQSYARVLAEQGEWRDRPTGVHDCCVCAMQLTDPQAYKFWDLWAHGACVKKELVRDETDLPPCDGCGECPATHIRGKRAQLKLCDECGETTKHKRKAKLTLASALPW